MLNARPLYFGASTGFVPFSNGGHTAAPGVAGGPDNASPPATQAAPEQKLSRQATQDLLKEMNRTLEQSNTGLEFSQDDETGWTVVKVIDRQTKETIRQFPSEEALAIAHTLDKLKGVLIQQTA